jgi:hypothetical protein
VQVDGYTVEVSQPNAKPPQERSEFTEPHSSSCSSSSSKEEPERKARKKGQPSIIKCRIGQCGLVLPNFELVQVGHRSDKLKRAIKALKGMHLVQLYQVSCCTVSAQSTY